MLSASALLLALSASSLASAALVLVDRPTTVDLDSLHNIHISYTAPSSFIHSLTFVYGDCSIDTPEDAHHDIGHADIQAYANDAPTRFVWTVPSETPPLGCVSIFDQAREILGRSKPIHVRGEHIRRIMQKRSADSKSKRALGKREAIADVADVEGPWFDGVAYMKNKNNTEDFISQAKNKKIAIVGGGMSGLMTALMLESVNITDWTIVESSGRVGGRVRTAYLAGSQPEDYQYQEMGPMRFPMDLQVGNETIEINDHRMVLQLADDINAYNGGNDTELAVKFIPWYDTNSNTPQNSRGGRLPNGLIPRTSDIQADPSLANAFPESSDPDALTMATEEFANFIGIPAKVESVAKNVFAAHKLALDEGLFNYTVAGYLRYALNMNLNITDEAVWQNDVEIGSPWSLLTDVTYFSVNRFLTIDKGLSSLPNAFMPLVGDRTVFNRTVVGMTYANENNNSKISLHWRDDPFKLETESEEFDYAVISAPFTRVRMWKPMPPYSSLLRRAIDTMDYDAGCKMALHYKSRFWEKGDKPIYGGCGSTDVPGIGQICYPSYAINSTGSGVVLAAYLTGRQGRSVAALNEEDYVALAQRTMIEIHGDVAREEWTGNYERKCWAEDEHIGSGWANPAVGQQDLYLPAYYQTEFKTIYIGEHTSYTHAWIWSALDSAVRGTTQLLLDLGLVDEAKELVDKWMARWISI